MSISQSFIRLEQNIIKRNHIWITNMLIYAFIILISHKNRPIIWIQNQSLLRIQNILSQFIMEIENIFLFLFRKMKYFYHIQLKLFKCMYCARTKMGLNSTIHLKNKMAQNILKLAYNFQQKCMSMKFLFFHWNFHTLENLLHRRTMNRTRISM